MVSGTLILFRRSAVSANIAVVHGTRLPRPNRSFVHRSRGTPEWLDLGRKPVKVAPRRVGGEYIREHGAFSDRDGEYACRIM